jgi:hypothetical protein
MILPLKLTPDNTQLIGANVAFGPPYALAAASTGIAYQTFNDWMKKGKNSTSREYYARELANFPIFTLTITIKGSPL